MAKRRFTDQIRAAVDASGMNQAEIARRLKISHVAVFKFMNGGGLSFDNLDRLADLLGLKVTSRKSGKGR